MGGWAMQLRSMSFRTDKPLHAHTHHAHTPRRTCPHTHARQGLCESVCGPCGAVTLPSFEKGQDLLGREEDAPSCGYWGCAFPLESTVASCSPFPFKEGVCVCVCVSVCLSLVMVGKWPFLLSKRDKISIQGRRLPLPFCARKVSCHGRVQRARAYGV